MLALLWKLAVKSSEFAYTFPLLYVSYYQGKLQLNTEAIIYYVIQ